MVFSRRSNDDNDWFIDIYEKYEYYVFWTTYMIVKNKTLAEDICQEVFIKIYEKYDDINNKDAVSTWIYRTTINTSINALNKEKRTIIGLDNENNKVIEDRTCFQPEESIINLETKNEIMKILYQIPDTQRIPLILYYFNDLSYKEIAKCLDCPIGTVKSRIHNGKRLIRNMIAGKEGVDLYEIRS